MDTNELREYLDKNTDGGKKNFNVLLFDEYAPKLSFSAFMHEEFHPGVKPWLCIDMEEVQEQELRNLLGGLINVTQHINDIDSYFGMHYLQMDNDDTILIKNKLTQLLRDSIQTRNLMRDLIERRRKGE